MGGGASRRHDRGAVTTAPKKRRTPGRPGTTQAYADRARPMISATLPAETLAHADAMAHADGVPRSRLLASLIDDEWERRGLDRAGEARIAEVRARNKKP